MIRNFFAFMLVGFVVTSLLCSNIEAIRNSDSNVEQCMYDKQIETDGPFLMESGQTTISRANVAASRPAYPQFTVPQLDQPMVRPGAPIMMAGALPNASGRSVFLRPAAMQPDPIPATGAATPKFGSVLLTDARGDPTVPPRYMVVALDPTTDGRTFAGVPLFQHGPGPAGGRPVCSGFLGAAAPSVAPLPGRANMFEVPLRLQATSAPRERLGWQVAEGVEMGVGIADLSFTAHAAYRVGQVAAHGGDVARVVRHVDPSALEYCGHAAKHAHLLPATKDSASIFAGMAHGGAHITAGVGVAFSGLSLVVNGRQMYVAVQGANRVGARREEIYEASEAMTQEEYDAAMAQCDAVVDHHGRSFALGAGGAAAAGIGGTCGVLILAGSAPVWAPPVALGAAIAGAGFTVVGVGRYWFDPEPELPEVPDSLLELVHDVDVNASSFRTSRDKEPSGGKKEGRQAKKPAEGRREADESAEEIDSMLNLKVDYVKEIVEPTWTRIFAKKHNLIPFYIDELWRALEKQFGLGLSFIQIEDPYNVIQSPEMDGKKVKWRREVLINLLQAVDHPSNKVWWASDLEDSAWLETVPAESQAFEPGERASDLAEPSSCTLLTARDFDRTTPAGMQCLSKGPSPDAYCQELFKEPQYICKFTIDRRRGVVDESSEGVCAIRDDLETSSLSDDLNAYGVRARKWGGEDTLEYKLVMTIENRDEFRQYWASLHGFNAKDWDDEELPESAEPATTTPPRKKAKESN